MKKALIIGNQNYINLPRLKQSTKDACKMNNILKILGYKTSCFYNIGFFEMNEKINEFAKTISDGDDIIFYFSGHGYSFSGHNYITPIDCISFTNINDFECFNTSFEEGAQTVDIEMILKQFARNVNGNNIIMIDACRVIYGIQLFKSKKIQELIEVPIKGSNVFISFATTLGNSANETINENSVYMEAFSKFIFRKNQTIDELFECIADYMVNNYNQVPCIIKNNKQTVMLIDNSNYSLIVEKQYYKEIVELYSEISSELLKNYQSEIINIDECTSFICNIIKGYVYFPNRFLEKFVRRVIKSFKDNLGIIGVLLDEKEFTRIDINANGIFIEGHFGEIHYFENKQLYLISNFERLIAVCKQKDSLVYTYESKTIIKYNNGYQLINNYSSSLKDLIISPLSFITDYNDNLKLMSTIIEFIQHKKSILFIGDPFVCKEEVIAACSEYFSTFEKITLLNDDKEIKILNGHKTSTSTYFEEVFKFNVNDFIDKLLDDRPDRLIYQNKSFRFNKQNYFNVLDGLNIPKIVSRDYKANLVEMLLQTSKLSFDLVVVLDVIKDIGSIISKVYVRDGVGWIIEYNAKIDYQTLDNYRNLLKEI